MTARVYLLYFTATFLLIHICTAQVISGLPSTVPNVPNLVSQGLKIYHQTQQISKAANSLGLSTPQTQKFVTNVALPLIPPVQRLATATNAGLANVGIPLLPTVASTITTGTNLRPLLNANPLIHRRNSLHKRSINKEEKTKKDFADAAINPIYEVTDDEYKEVIGSSGSVSNDSTVREAHQIKYQKTRSPDGYNGDNGDDLDYLSKAANPSDKNDNFFKKAWRKMWPSSKSNSNNEEDTFGPGSGPASDMESDPGSDLGRDPGSDLGSRPGSALGSDPRSGLGSRLGSGPGSSLGSRLGSGPGSRLGSGPGSRLGSGPGSGAIDTIPFRDWASTYKREHPETPLGARELKTVYIRILKESGYPNYEMPKDLKAMGFHEVRKGIEKPLNDTLTKISHNTKQTAEEMWNFVEKWANDFLNSMSRRGNDRGIDSDSFKTWGQNYLREHPDEDLTTKQLSDKYIDNVMNDFQKSMSGFSPNATTSSRFSQNFNQPNQMDHFWNSAPKLSDNFDDPMSQSDNTSFKIWARRYLNEHPDENLTMKELTNIYMNNVMHGFQTSRSEPSFSQSQKPTSFFGKSNDPYNHRDPFWHSTAKSSNNFFDSMSDPDNMQIDDMHIDNIPFKVWAQKYLREHSTEHPNMTDLKDKYAIELMREFEKSGLKSTPPQNEKFMQSSQKNNYQPNYNQHNQMNQFSNSAPKSSNNCDSMSLSDNDNHIETIPFRTWAQQYQNQNAGKQLNTMDLKDKYATELMREFEKSQKNNCKQNFQQDTFRIPQNKQPCQTDQSRNFAGSTDSIPFKTWALQYLNEYPDDQPLTMKDLMNTYMNGFQNSMPESSFSQKEYCNNQENFRQNPLCQNKQTNPMDQFWNFATSQSKQQFAGNSDFPENRGNNMMNFENTKGNQFQGFEDTPQNPRFSQAFNPSTMTGKDAIYGTYPNMYPNGYYSGNQQTYQPYTPSYNGAYPYGSTNPSEKPFGSPNFAPPGVSFSTLGSNYFAYPGTSRSFGNTFNSNGNFESFENEQNVNRNFNSQGGSIYKRNESSKNIKNSSTGLRANTANTRKINEKRELLKSSSPTPSKSVVNSATLIAKQILNTTAT